MTNKSLHLYLSQYDNIIIVGDFSTEIGASRASQLHRPYFKEFTSQFSKF